MLATFAYDNYGRRSSITRGNGTVTSYTYDSVSRLYTLTQNLDGSGTANDNTDTLDYSPASQIASLEQSNEAVYSWSPSSNQTKNYTPNGLNQLTIAAGQSVSHDSRGNITGDGSTTFCGAVVSNF